MIILNNNKIFKIKSIMQMELYNNNKKKLLN